ncbi:MAG: TOMM precursor leader peptide-binding protein [Cyanobacteria bacterium P01_G01_bin.54]
MPFQIKPHYHIEILEPKQVYLLGEQDNHALTGQLYCQILPFLDGHHSREQIAEQLNGEVPLDYIDFVLDRLNERGYLTEAAPELPPEVAAFWSELGIAPAKAAQALKQPVCLKVAGSRISQAMVDSLATALQDLGIPIQGEDVNSTALTVVLTDDYLHPDLVAFNQHHLQTRQPWLLVKPLGSVLWLGPVFQPGETGCWHCLAHRLEGNREVEASVQRQKQYQAYAAAHANGNATADLDLQKLSPYLPTARAALPSTVQTSLQFAATEIAKHLVRSFSPNGVVELSNLNGKLLTLNHRTLELKTHILSRRPQCSSCGDPELLSRRGFTDLVLVPRQKQFTRDGGHRALTPQETVQKHEHLISPITGVVTELVRLSDPSNPLVHTYRAGHAFGEATSLRGLRSKLKHKSSGKGKTDSQSRASGFCEAVERYSGIYQGDEPRKAATFDELGELAINPEVCLCISDTQYANRKEINKSRQATHDWIPTRFDPAQTLDWTPVWSLTEQRHKYLPTAFCYYNYPTPKGQRFCRADSNGNAAGNTLEEAILQGFMELVERDSVGLWWYNRLQRPAVDLTSFAEPYFCELQQHYAANHRELWVLDLTADLAIPAFVGVSRRTLGESERLILGFGAHLDPTIALLRTLTELNQIGLELDKVPDEELDGDAKQWLLEATLENQPYLVPDPQQSLKTAQDYPRCWGEDIREDVLGCVALAQEAGLETLVLDQTRPDIGLNVVKVIVPGLRHFWSRFGPGRLYDVPVQLGWRETPTPEAQMNPMAMPF